MNILRMTKDLWVPIVVSLFLFIIGTALKADLATQLAMAMFGFATPLLVMIVIRLDDWENFLKVQRRVIEVDHFSDDSLRRIHEAFLRISEGGKAGDALFESFYRRRMTELCNHISDAARTGQLRIDSNHHYMTDTVLGIFDADGVDTFCETYIIEDENDIFDMHSLNYLVKVLKRADEGSIKKIRSLFVFDGEKPSSESMFMSLCALHHAKEQCDFRIIHPDLYAEVLRDAHIQQEFIDFGLYGNELMFKTVTYVPSTAGFFSRNRPNIKEFQSFFDACWNSPAAYSTEHENGLDPAQLLQKITQRAKDAYNRKVARGMPTTLDVAQVASAKEGIRIGQV